MKKTVMALITIISVIFLSAVLIAAEKIELNEAFKKGIISITIKGLARGELVEMRITRQSANPLVVVINKGRTDIAEEVSILLKKKMEIDLTSKDSEILTLPQTGSSRFNRGPLMLESTPPAAVPGK